jgi:hypothetical protein
VFDQLTLLFERWYALPCIKYAWISSAIAWSHQLGSRCDRYLVGGNLHSFECFELTAVQDSLFEWSGPDKGKSLNSISCSTYLVLSWKFVECTAMLVYTLYVLGFSVLVCLLGWSSRRIYSRHELNCDITCLSPFENSLKTLSAVFIVDWLCFKVRVCCSYPHWFFPLTSTLD